MCVTLQCLQTLIALHSVCKKFKRKLHKLYIKIQLTSSAVIPSKYVEPIIRSIMVVLFSSRVLSPHCHQTKNTQKHLHTIQYTLVV